VYSSHLYDMLADNPEIPSFNQDKETSKFWI
jgi:hypothetical protein